MQSMPNEKFVLVPKKFTIFSWIHKEQPLSAKLKQKTHKLLLRQVIYLYL